MTVDLDTAAEAGYVIIAESVIVHPETAASGLIAESNVNEIDVFTSTPYEPCAGDVEISCAVPLGTVVLPVANPNDTGTNWFPAKSEKSFNWSV